MQEQTKQINNLIEALPINDIKFKSVLSQFSQSALETFRGGQKNSCTREVAECIFWLSNEYLNSGSIAHLQDEFFEFYETDNGFMPDSINDKLAALWHTANNAWNGIYIARIKNNNFITKLEKSGFFPNSVSRAQCYFIDGVLENLYDDVNVLS